MRRTVVAIALAATVVTAGACGSSPRRTGAASEPSSPAAATVATSGQAPTVDFSTVDSEMRSLNSNLSSADSGMNSTQEGDVSQ